MSVTPGLQTVLQNSTATYSVGIATTNNYGGSFTASCSGLPSPAACNASVFNVAVQTNSLPIGNYTFDVSVSNGIASRSASAQLNIGDFAATLSSNSLTVGAGQNRKRHDQCNWTKWIRRCGGAQLQRRAKRHHVLD